jgi:hypothetical protein
VDFAARTIQSRSAPAKAGTEHDQARSYCWGSWHQTLKNWILAENYYLPGDLEAQIEAFVADYNRLRYHEGIGNLTPADVYLGRGRTILIERERIKTTDHCQSPFAAPTASRITS